MRVGLDVSPLRQTRAGSARYIEGLLPHLERDEALELRRFAFGGGGRAAAAARDVAWYLGVLPVQARRARVAVLHCPTFRAPVRSRVPLVVTVHDLAVLRHPRAFNRWSRGYGRVFVPRVVEAAARVIAVSEFTKRELVDTLGTRAEKIRVIPHGVGETFTSEGAAADGDYVLAVGTLEPRKNLPRLAAAVARLGVELRVAGARGWGDVRLQGDGVRWLGEPPDEELARLYRGALCVAYPSLYEGFGLPVLEAMACGAPVVTSAGTAMEEVAGGAAVLVDPEQPDAIAAGVEQAIARRDELARLGVARARGFSWSEAAAATTAVYAEVAA